MTPAAGAAGGTAGAATPHAERRRRLRRRLDTDGLDALLVTDLVNVRYLTGFTGSAGALLVGGDADVLVTDGRYAEQAADQAPDVEHHTARGDGWLRHRVRRGRLGLEDHTVPWGRARVITRLLPDVEVVAAGGHVEVLRTVKDPGELRALARACAVGDAAFADLTGVLEPGTSERATARRLVDLLLAHGADDRAFEPIVASGPNSARPHHRPTDRLLAPGDVVKLDFGALVDGYHSDMTRVVALGRPDPVLEEVFAVVRSAQASGLRAVRSGLRAAAVDEACREVIADAGHGDRFVHGTGHGVGLRIHEAPLLSARSDATLAAGMAVTVEPGVYLPGVGGIRIEDTVVVQDGDPRVLTATAKDLLVL